MKTLTITTGTNATNSEVNYAMDNGYNGLLDSATETHKNAKVEVLVNYTLYHNSGDAALGLVGSSLVKCSSVEALAQRLDSLMAADMPDHRGNKNKGSVITIHVVKN